jgi:hypothetical protein
METPKLIIEEIIKISITKNKYILVPDLNLLLIGASKVL